MARSEGTRGSSCQSNATRHARCWLSSPHRGAGRGAKHRPFSHACTRPFCQSPLSPFCLRVLRRVGGWDHNDDRKRQNRCCRPGARRRASEQKPRRARKWWELWRRRKRGRACGVSRRRPRRAATSARGASKPSLGRTFQADGPESQKPWGRRLPGMLEEQLAGEGGRVRVNPPSSQRCGYYALPLQKRKLRLREGK